MVPPPGNARFASILWQRARYSSVIASRRLHRHYQRIVDQQRVVDAVPLGEEEPPRLAAEAVEVAPRLMDRRLLVDEGLQHHVVRLRRDRLAGGGENPRV